jgi:hypothetical protein
LRFGICYPEGHAFAQEGLHLERHRTAHNPG